MEDSGFFFVFNYILKLAFAEYSSHAVMIRFLSCKTMPGIGDFVQLIC